MKNHFNEKAMLVVLNISFWASRKHDKKVSQEVADDHGTDVNVGRYRKNLLPFDAPSYKAVINALGNARVENYNHTLPWSNDGARILPAANFERYTEAMRSKKVEFDKAVKTFLEDYPVLRDKAKESLKTMYRPEDYPTVGEIERRFSFSTKVFPLPAGEDFRVELASDDVSEIRGQIEQEIKLAVADAMKDAYGRLHEVVSRMAARLSDKEARFKRSLVENIAELCDILPSLNLTGDAELTRLIDDSKAKLTRYDADTLREDSKLRDRVARDAKQIENDLAAFMAR